MQSWNPSRFFALVVAEGAPKRNALKSMLEDMRLRQVFETPTAQTCLEFLAKTTESIDLIVYCQGLSNMTAIELRRRLRDRGAGEPLLILIDEPAQENAAAPPREAGIAAYLAAPITPSQLEEKIRIALSQRQSVSSR
jgi:CheY-like chemotaxis protein